MTTIYNVYFTAPSKHIAKQKGGGETEGGKKHAENSLRARQNNFDRCVFSSCERERQPIEPGVEGDRG